MYEIFYTEENNEVCLKQSVIALRKGSQDIIFFVLFLNQAIAEDRSSLVVQ